MRVAYDPYHQAVGPEWTMWAAGGLFLLVLAVSILLTVHFNRRDARRDAHIREVVERFRAARTLFMNTVEGFQSGRYTRQVIFTVCVLQADASLKAFAEATALAPELEPDADWLNALKWIELKAKSFGFIGGGA